MTKVDERSVVPAVDAAALARLGAALDREGVVAALLFGSHASDSAGPLSDIDVAVWLDPVHPMRTLAGARLELADAAARALGTGEVDLVVLNDAPSILRHRAMRDGTMIVDRDPRARVRLETESLLEYLDTEALRTTLARARRKRLAEGRFGRR